MTGEPIVTGIYYSYVQCIRKSSLTEEFYLTVYTFKILGLPADQFDGDWSSSQSDPLAVDCLFFHLSTVHSVVGLAGCGLGGSAWLVSADLNMKFIFFIHTKKLKNKVPKFQVHHKFIQV